MLRISPMCFGTGVTFSGILRTWNARCDWQNISSSCSSRIQFFPFRPIIDLSALWLTASSVRIVAVCVHFLRRTFIYCFLSPAETFYWPRKLINMAAKGLGCLSLFYSCRVSAVSFFFVRNCASILKCEWLELRVNKPASGRSVPTDREAKPASVRLEVTWLQSSSTLEIELFTETCYYLFDNVRYEIDAYILSRSRDVNREKILIDSFLFQLIVFWNQVGNVKTSDSLCRFRLIVSKTARINRDEYWQ
jgi:hypothetical protein